MVPKDLVLEALGDPRIAQPTHYARGKTPEGEEIDATLQPLDHGAGLLGGPGWLVSVIVHRAGCRDVVKGNPHKRYESARREFDGIVARWGLREP